MSTKLNREKLNFVIGKLKSIRDAIADSKADDIQKEGESKTKFANLKREVDTISGKKIALKGTAERKLKSDQASLDIAEPK